MTIEFVTKSETKDPYWPVVQTEWDFVPRSASLCPVPYRWCNHRHPYRRERTPLGILLPVLPSDRWPWVWEDTAKRSPGTSWVRSLHTRAPNGVLRFVPPTGAPSTPVRPIDGEIDNAVTSEQGVCQYNRIVSAPQLRMLISISLSPLSLL